MVRICSSLCWSMAIVLIGWSLLFAAPTGPNDTLRNELGQPIFPPFPSQPGIDCVKNQVIAAFFDGALNLPLGTEEAQLQSCTGSSQLIGLLTSYDVYYVQKVFKGFFKADTLVTIGDTLTVGLPDLSQIYLLKLMDTGKDLFSLISALQARSECIYAEPNGIMHATGPNDPRFPNQWNLPAYNPLQGKYGIDAEEAWIYSKGSPNIRVGIFDTGIDYNHQDFGGGGLGSSKIPTGYDFVDNDLYPYSNTAYHGTATAGIAAALTNNQTGIAGVSGGWNQSLNDIGSVIIPMQILSNSNGQGDWGTAARAIWAGSDPDGAYRCDILSNSWGGYSYSETVRIAVFTASARWRSFVAAKGNDGTNQQQFPSDYDGSWVISVGGYNNGGFRNLNSNYGNNMDILAPWGVPATFPNNQYSTLGGTSSSCPHASGTAALIRSLRPGLHPDDIDRILAFSAVDGGEIGYDPLYGYGRLNAGNALGKLGPVQRVSPPYQLFFHTTAPGGRDVSQTGVYSMFVYNRAPYNLSTGRYLVRRHDVRVDVVFEERFLNVPKVWGRGVNLTRGWSQANPNLMAEFNCTPPGVEPTLTGCELQTFVYEVWNIMGQFIGWYPCRPSEVQCAYTIWGQLQNTPPPPPPSRPDSTGKYNSAIVPSFSSIGEPYPNPFNGSTMVNFSISNSVNVNIQIYDILGRCIQEDILGVIEPGNHSYIWSGHDRTGQDAPSGVYFMAIKADGGTAVRKLSLLR